MNLFESIYNHILLEALWDVNWEDDTDIDPNEEPFSVNLYTMYALEYKRHRLKSSKFSGLEQRKDNILKQVENRLSIATKNVHKVLLETLGKWLESHAITSPKRWAAARMRDLDDYESDTGESILSAIINEYARYKWPNKMITNPSGIMYRIMTEMSKNIDNFPNFKRIIETILLPINREWRQEEFDSNPEEFKETCGVQTDEQAQEIIDKLTINDIDVDLSIVDSIESFNDMVDRNMGLDFKMDFFKEIYEKLVFPVWYGHWQSLGIDKTRTNIEHIYENLQKANQSNLNNLILWTSAALNVAHQNGPMLEYVEENTGESYLQRLATDLTDGKYNQTWDNELREVGVQNK